jgi:hypothetical protein
MITLERLGRGPFPPMARTRTWGGSLKREKGERRRGIMDWSDPRPCGRQDLLFVRQKLQEALAEVEKELR